MTNPAGMKFRYQVATQYPLQPHNLETIGLAGDDVGFLGYSRDYKALYSMFLTSEQLKNVKRAPFFISVESGQNSPSGFSLFPNHMNGTWSLNEYGPLTVPKKGMSVQVNATTMNFYGELIEQYEGNENVNINKGKLEIDGKMVANYTFRQDYYFMMGDSRDNSIDSRYYGFVPKSYIVGKPVMVLFSRNADGEGLNKVRWGRIFSGIE
jgi:signal peptidase I